MKKFCLIALVLVLTLSLTACFGGNNDEKTDTGANTEATTTAPQTDPTVSLPLPTIDDPATDPSGSMPGNDGTIPGAANEDMYDNTEATTGSHRRMPGMGGMGGANGMGAGA